MRGIKSSRFIKPRGPALSGTCNVLGASRKNVSTFEAFLNRVGPVPTMLGTAQLRLDGARYCSIGDSIAVQCRLSDAAGERYTLYQFRPRGAQRAITPGSHDLGDVSVQIWHQGGLCCGLAV